MELKPPAKGAGGRAKTAPFGVAKASPTSQQPPLLREVDQRQVEP